MEKKLTQLIPFLGSVIFCFSFLAESSLFDYLGKIIGGLLILIGFVVFQMKSNEYSKSKKLLSSNLSFFYNSFLPALVLAADICFLVASFGGDIPSIYLDSGIVLIPFSLLSFWFYFKVKLVAYDDNYIYIEGNDKKISKELDQSIELNRFGFFFYKMKFDNLSVLFIPHILSLYLSFGTEPKYIKEFKTRIAGLMK